MKGNNMTNQNNNGVSRVNQEKTKNSFFIVKNTTSKIKTFYLADPNDTKERTNNPICVRFKIGINTVNSDIYKKLESNHDFKTNIEAGHFKLIYSDVQEAKTQAELKEAQEKEAKNKMDGASDELGGFNAKEAIEIVNETMDILLLKKWEKEDERTTVSRSIVKKIEELMTNEEKGVI